MYPAKADSNDEDYQLVKLRVHHAHIAKELIQTFRMESVRQLVQHPRTQTSTRILRTRRSSVTGCVTGSSAAMVKAIWQNITEKSLQQLVSRLLLDSRVTFDKLDKVDRLAAFATAKAILSLGDTGGPSEHWSTIA